MRLNQLQVRDWRNAQAVELELGSDLVVLHGANGAGKTNLLEAVGVLATWKSFRSAPWEQVLRWGAPVATVQGVSRSELGSAELGVSVGRVDGGGCQRRSRMDGAPVREPGPWFARLRAVTFTPDDVQIVRGGPELRRRFMDRACFNAWPTHLDQVRVFRRVLSQRAALLRSGRATRRELEAWDTHLAEASVGVVLGRRRLVKALVGPLRAVHGDLSGGIPVGLRYRSSLAPSGDGGWEPVAMAERFMARLHALRDEELRRGLNLAGPQRDDLILDLGQEGERLESARSFGSQGQVRTLALALKLAELSVAGSGGDPPLLLVDDLSSELDARRLARLVSHIEQLRSQVVVTTTDPGPILACSGRGGEAVEIRLGTVASVVSHG
jgi:DNA replication and repair protein RecF